MPDGSVAWDGCSGMTPTDNEYSGSLTEVIRSTSRGDGLMR
jgi:hypothetical protein